VNTGIDYSNLMAAIMKLSKVHNKFMEPSYNRVFRYYEWKVSKYCGFY